MLFTSNVRQRPTGALKIDHASPPMACLPILGEIAQADNPSQVYWIVEACPPGILLDACAFMLKRPARYDAAAIKQVLKRVGFKPLAKKIGQAPATAAFQCYNVEEKMN